MLKLFPPLQPYVTHSLKVDELHTLHVEECGNPSGVPVVFLHGGPGGACSADHRRYFDPDVYRIVLFDQRGCGRSTPHAELTDNTTHDLVQDIETIREHLKIEQWVVFGGSWGSTLALVYAERHTDQVLGLILRGIFLCRPGDFDWFYQQGASRVFPDHWESFIQPIPEEERDNLLQAYHQRLVGDDELARMAAAKAWSIWEGRCATLQHNPALVNHFAEPYAALALARIECHYFINDCFLEPDHILKNIDKIQDLPGYIIHGRYDMVCPLDQAWTLYKTWPKAQLKIVHAGHAASEPTITDALVHATIDMAKNLS